MKYFRRRGDGQGRFSAESYSQYFSYKTLVAVFCWVLCGLMYIWIPLTSFWGQAHTVSAGQWATKEEFHWCKLLNEMELLGVNLRISLKSELGKDSLILGFQTHMRESVVLGYDWHLTLRFVLYLTDFFLILMLTRKACFRKEDLGTRVIQLQGRPCLWSTWVEV